MKGGFIRWFADHPTAANLLMLIFLFLGAITAGDIKRETFPEFTASQVQVSVVYPGASAEDVEDSICQIIEDELDGMPQVEEVRSVAVEGSATVTVEMVEGGDLERFLADVRSEIDAIADFPQDAEEPVISEMNRTDMVLSVAVSGPMSVPDLKLYCEDLKDRMLRIPGISDITIHGFSDHQIKIEIPAGTLMQYGLSVQDVADRITRQSVDLPGGLVRTPEADFMVRFADERRTVREFEDLTVHSGTTGAEIRLGDIARVSDDFETDEDKIVFNGRRAGMLQVNKAKDEDALDTVDAVNAFLERERLQAPSSVEYTVTRNISKIVRDRLTMLVDNGLMGLVLVFAAMWLFFAFRFSFWVSLGLPVSFMGGLFGMHLAGLSLNMLSMVGLLLATGLIMDDAIVIAENVHAHLARGKKALDAAVDGTREVGLGVVSSFATTVLIFGTIALLIEGRIGKVMWVMPVVLILTLAVSLVEAFLILPNHLAHALHGKEDRPRHPVRRRFDGFIEHLRERWLGRAVDWAMRWRYLWAGLVLSLFLVSVGMLAGGRLKTVVFPEIDGDVLESRVLLPQGTPLERTEAVVARLTTALDEVNETLRPRQPGGRDLVENVNVQYATNSDAGESGPHVATVSADLLSAEVRDATIDETAALWRERTGDIPDIITIAFKEPSVGPGGLAIDIRLQGRDLDKLKAASMELQEWLSGYDGVLDLQDDLRPGKPEFRVRLKEGALALGLDAASVARQLRAAYQGVNAAEIQHLGETYEVNVRLARADRDGIADLEYFHVTTASGVQVPLRSVADIEPGRGYARITRVDSRRTVNITGDVDAAAANAAEIRSDTAKRFLPKLTERYPDITFSLEGQAEEGAKTGKSMQRAMLIGLFGIFVLLSLQFKSYVEPLIVMVAIPLAFIGVVWGHLLMGLDLSMPSIMGFVSLAGVVVNDSILLVTFIKLNRLAGKSGPDAARTASRNRFRAVLLTSLTTVMGLLPLLAERSLQAQVLVPLATSIVFGLMASTVLVLLVIPALYAILDDFGLAREVEAEEDAP